jgi:hypothetical protein
VRQAHDLRPLMTSSSTPHWPIKLRFEDRVRVAGEIVAGHVDLNIVLANELHIQRLWIKLRGAIKTYALFNVPGQG